MCIYICVHVHARVSYVHLPSNFRFLSYLSEDLGVLWQGPSTVLVLGKWNSVLQFLLLATSIFSKTKQKQAKQNSFIKKKTKKQEPRALLQSHPLHSRAGRDRCWTAFWTAFWLQVWRNLRFLSQVLFSVMLFSVILGGGKLSNQDQAMLSFKNSRWRHLGLPRNDLLGSKGNSEPQLFTSGVFCLVLWGSNVLCDILIAFWQSLLWARGWS